MCTFCWYHYNVTKACFLIWILIAGFLLVMCIFLCCCTFTSVEDLNTSSTALLYWAILAQKNYNYQYYARFLGWLWCVWIFFFNLRIIVNFYSYYWNVSCWKLISNLMCINKKLQWWLLYLLKGTESCFYLKYFAGNLYDDSCWWNK